MRGSRESQLPSSTTAAQEPPDAVLLQLLPLHGDASAGAAQPADLHAPGALPRPAAARLGALGLPQRELAGCLSGPRLLPAQAALEVRQGGRRPGRVLPEAVSQGLLRGRENRGGGWSRAEPPRCFRG